MHLLNAVFGHKNNQIRNEGHRNCAFASSCTDATSQRNKHRADLRATTNSGQRAPHHQRVQSPGQPLAGVPLPGAGHDQPMRRSALGARPAPAHGHWRGEPREMERGSRPTAASPLARTRAPGSRLRHSVREGPHCFRSLAHVARGRIASAPVRVAGRAGYAPTCSNGCMAPDRRSVCKI